MSKHLMAAFTALILCASPALSAQDEGSEESVNKGDSWKLCTVKIDLVRTSGRGSKSLYHDERLMFLGEQADIVENVNLQEGDRSALLDLRLRIRATAALDAAALFTVTTEATLLAALGFTAEPKEKDQFRHELIELRESSTHVHEVCRLGGLGNQVMLFLSARPVPPKPELSDPLLAAPNADLLTMKVEAFHVGSGDRRSLVQSGRVATGVGRAGSLEFSLGTMEQRKAEEEIRAGEKRYKDRHLRKRPDELHREADEKKGEDRFGEGVRAVEIEGLKPSGFGKDHIVTERREGRDYKVGREVRGNTEWLDEHAVDLRNDDLIIGTVTRSKKISKRKREKLRAIAEAQAGAERAIELSKQLSGVAHPSDAAESEVQRLLIRVEPLFMTDWNIRFELHVEGRISLPGEEGLHRIDATVVESVGHGESLELNLASLTQSAAAGEYLLSITPEL